MTEVVVTHEERSNVDSCVEEGGVGVPAGMHPGGGDEKHGDGNNNVYSVNIEAAAQRRGGVAADVLNVRTITRDVAASNANAESWLYARVAFLYFLSLAIIWVRMRKTSHFLSPPGSNIPLLRMY